MTRDGRARALGALDTQRVAFRLCVAGVAVVAVLQGIALWNGYRASFEQYRTIVESHASGVAQHWRDTLGGIDAGLQDIVVRSRGLDLDLPRGVATLRSALTENRPLTRAAEDLWFVDRAGRVVAGASDAASILRADAGVGAALAGADGLVVGERATLGDGEGRPVLLLARAARDGEGTVVGAAVAALSIEAVSRTHAAIRLPAGAHVAILDRSGRLLIHTPARLRLVGEPLVDAGAFAALWRGEAAINEVDLVIAEPSRFLGFARVASSDTAVMVSLPQGAAVSSWQRQLVWSTGALTVLVLVLALFGVTMVRSYRRRDEVLAATGARQRELTAVVERLLGLGRAGALVDELAGGVRRLTSAETVRVRITAGADLGAPYERVASGEADPAAVVAALDAGGSPAAGPAQTLVRLAGEERRGLHYAIDGEDDGWSGRMDLVAPAGGGFAAGDAAIAEQLSRIAATLLDKITLVADLRRAVATGEARRAEIETIFRSISDAVFSLDPRWRFTFLNPKAEELLQRSADDLVGRSIWEAFPDAVETEVKPAYERAMRDGVDVALEFYYPALACWFSLRAFPRPDGLTVYFRDVSERVFAEAQLRQAQKMEALGQLTGGIAHDFNNLLTVIMGNLELLADAADLAEADRESLRVALSASEQAAQLTEQLLAFARRQPLAPRDVDVRDLVQEWLKLMKRTLGPGVALQTLLEGGLDPIHVDPVQLQNAVLNLALNARDAMGGQGRLTIEAANRRLDAAWCRANAPGLAPGRYVRLSVADTGPGMADDVRERAFDPFFTTKGSGGGSGLGLAMVYGFAKQSEGHVSLYSEPGVGTTVALYLPAATAAAVSDDDEAAQEIPGGVERVLVVEDEPDVRNVVVRGLARLGYDVAAVGDAEAGAAALAGDGLEVLVSDIGLPGGMNGLELARRARDQRGDLAVVLISGYAAGGLAGGERIPAGAVVLQKPVHVAELAQAIRHALDAARATPARHRRRDAPAARSRRH